MRKMIILSFLVCVLLYACRHLPPDTTIAPGPPGRGNGGTLPICFSTEILPLFQQRCATPSCHSATSTDPLARRYILDSYNNLFKKDGQVNNNNIRPGDPDHSDLWKVLVDSLISNKRMPRPPFSFANPDLTASQKNLIAQWISEGAQNTTCSGGSTCDTTKFTYTAIIQPILVNHCTGCHSGINPPDGYNFTLYADAHRAAVTNYAPGDRKSVV